MRPTQRIKVKNGIEYWYEETPYYDPVKKQIRHRSKYLGRNVDGQPVRMRSAPDEVKEKTKKKTVAVKSSYDYGSIFVLQSIIKELNLDRYLGALLPPEDVSMILALAFNRIIRPMTMDNVSSWYEGTSLALESPRISLSRQRIDEQLIRLGKSDIPDRFISQLIKGSDTKSAIVYEIAGSSNPPESISFFEHECDPEC
ncbi:MAG TPA: IS1634 family transposase, partial [Methanothrix sp.]|nr:IS1634 family transposase [Methanothrix sp.]